MASDFPMVYYTGLERGPMNLLYTPDAAATFKALALVFMNTSDQEIEECGADPALILGKAAADAANKFLYDGRIPVEVITPDVEYGMCVSGTLAATDLMKAYGVVKLASGNWAVDLSDTTNTRVTIVRADITQQIAFVKFLAANLQGDSIAS